MAVIDNTLAAQIPTFDPATPLMQAAQIQNQQAQAQQAQFKVKQEQIGSEARGLVPFVNTPDFPAKWAEAADRMHDNGLLDDRAHQQWRNTPSPLLLKQMIAQTSDPTLEFKKQEAQREQGNMDQGFGLQQQKFAFEKEQANKPVTVSPGQSLVEPKTGKVVYQGSGGLSEAGNEIAARQIINGDLSALTNIGRGAQGDAKLTSIKNKAAEILINENGMTPADAAAHLGQKLQAFKASTIGQGAEARTGATREANLNIILKATEAAIPAALAASDAVERYAGKFVPLNKIIQNGQVMTSDADLRKFGMANLQLAEHWARAMNPTGVMRESDRDMALGFLSTADSKDTYRQVVNQLKVQITRERDAISKAGLGQPAPTTAAPQPDPFGIR